MILHWVMPVLEVSAPRNPRHRTIFAGAGRGFSRRAKGAAFG